MSGIESVDDIQRVSRPARRIDVLKLSRNAYRGPASSLLRVAPSEALDIWFPDGD